MPEVQLLLAELLEELLLELELELLEVLLLLLEVLLELLLELLDVLELLALELELELESPPPQPPRLSATSDTPVSHVLETLLPEIAFASLDEVIICPPACLMTEAFYHPYVKPLMNRVVSSDAVW